MKVADILDILEDSFAPGSADIEFSGVKIDSRAVQPGDLFVALKGTRSDGHAFIDDAIANGASFVVCQEDIESEFPHAVVPDSAKALALIAARFYGDPGRRLVMVGVTGTDGKTTVSHLLRSIVDGSGFGRMGIAGTLGFGVGEELRRTAHTTSDAVTLQENLRQMAQAGSRGVVMEVSSHAVRQHRTWGLDFEVGILTNVTHDHLDYHSSIEDYRAAKAEFCRSLAGPHRHKPDGVLIYWNEDPVARRIGVDFEGKKISVGANAEADVFVSQVSLTLERTEFVLHMPGDFRVPVRMRMLGAFCPTNAALAAAAALALGIDHVEIKEGLEGIRGVPGRFEAFGGEGKPVAIIDYCHTPDAMRRVLQTCLDLNPGRLTAVFGCGGDRDRSKRPLMGGIAQEMCGRCFLTTDNPRTESVRLINEEIMSGMTLPDANVVVEPDRARAIARAVSESGPGDVVAVLGKGHEDYQIIGEDKLPYSDKGEVEGALDRWSAR